MRGVLEKPAPNDIHAEEAVIASLLVDASAVNEVAPLLEPADFFRERHGIIYDAEIRLWKRGTAINTITVANELGRLGMLDAAGGIAFLSQITTDLPTSVGVKSYAEIVARDARYRRLISAAGQIAQTAFDGGPDWDQKHRYAMDMIAALTYDPGVGLPRKAGVIMDATMPRLMEWMADPSVVRGYRTGLFALDAYLDGLEAGRLYVVAGSPGMGKSMLALNMATGLADGVRDQEPIPVYYISAEMNAEQLAMRALFARSGVDRNAARWSGELSEESERKLMEATSWFSELPLEIDDGGPFDWDSLSIRIKRAVGGGAKVVMLDHLHLFTLKGKLGEDEESVRTITKITRESKLLAEKLGVPIVLCSQLNRNRADNFRKSKAPVLTDLRGSGTIEQDADVVIGLYRPWMDDPDGDSEYVLEYHIIKNRDGRVGMVKGFVDVNTGQIGDLR